MTLQTIADRVGVSRTTVSNAFSRPDQLSASLREQIHAVAEELGYGGPDPLARSLRTGRAGAVGVLLSETLGYTLRDPYAGALLAGIADAMEERGTADASGLLLLPLPPGGEDTTLVRDAVVDGFVVSILPRGHPALQAVLARDLPTVTVDGPQIDGVPFVHADERRAARELGDAVLAAGHEDLLVLTFRLLPDEHVGEVTDERLAAATYQVSSERLAGLLEATRAVGLPRERVQIHEVGENLAEPATDAVGDALASARPPTAVVCLSDRLALSVLTSVRAAGLDVPGDVSVTGWDDIPAAEVAGLTTVHQPAHEKGRQALRLLRAGDAAADVVVDSGLVTRRTLGPPP